MAESAILDAPAPSPTAQAAQAVIAARKEGTPINVGEIKAKLKPVTVAAPEKSADDKAALKTVAAESSEKKPGPKSGEKAAKEQRENDALARHALKRAKFTDEEIDGMNPADRILTGLKLKTQQDDASRSFAESKTSQSGKSQRSPEGEGESRSTDPANGERQPQREPDTGVSEPEELAQVLEALQEEHAEVLRKHITADLSKAEKAVKDAKKAEKAAREEMFAMRQESTRALIEKQYPKISETKRFDEVLEFMARLSPKDQWSSLPKDEFKDNMNLAASAVFGREAIEAARAEHTEQLSEDLAGQPHVGGTKASGDGTKVSKEQLAARAIIAANGDASLARKNFDRMRGL